MDPTAGIVSGSSAPSAYSSVSPSKSFGSGKTTVPVSPAISTKPVRPRSDSNEKTLCAQPPFSNWISAEWFVGTTTGKSVPAFGPEPIVRVARDFYAVAVTFATGPNACTRVVM